MTLRDKFEQWFINDEDDEHYVGMVEAVAIEHEKIAEELAIEFAEWLNGLDINDEVLQKHISTFELLEMYKKEKGL